ncbi:hypothetical protein J7T55_014863 [Diaporthe amygdali]|uniref:uncharacterized protein n=1 Tax=Phomopsis amygdali TaxID=1214568 RepID=UPI0022FF296E|nr:uncharacterized protein J7T55_014863 [Diaporthe amygdali]KAJ0110060.1 hypothetical protein J7T55_014863 [Diaporthe amygdali]
MPNGPGAASISTIESIIKPAEATGGSGKTKCIECDGYECCCIPIPCVVITHLLLAYPCHSQSWSIHKSAVDVEEFACGTLKGVPDLPYLGTAASPPHHDRTNIKTAVHDAFSHNM